MGKDGDGELPSYRPGSRPKGNHPCTHRMGYVRQDVYTCLKCMKMGPDGEPMLAGFCIGCKTSCHSKCGDAVIDLYSKRFFRCDCGNSRMTNKCVLLENKADDNTDNERVYNHNFLGKYCRCDRGYDLKLGDMLQCAMCEDWFHEVCLRLPDGSTAARTRTKLRKKACELICATCADKNQFLDRYYPKSGLFLPPECLPISENVVSLSPGCQRPPDVDSRNLIGKDRFWNPGFRLKLCKCAACKEEYTKNNISYITDKNDFVQLSGINEDDLLPNAPDDDEIRKQVADKKRKKRKSTPRKKPPKITEDSEPEDMDIDEDEVQSPIKSSPIGSSPSTAKRIKPTKRIELSDEERQKMREAITKYVNSAIEKEPLPERDDVRKYLEKLRAQILQLSA